MYSVFKSAADNLTECSSSRAESAEFLPLDESKVIFNFRGYEIEIEPFTLSSDWVYNCIIRLRPSGLTVYNQVERGMFFDRLYDSAKGLI